MTITYTNKLGLPVITDGDQNWGQAMRIAMQTLDDNPGIVSVANNASMEGLDTWPGRMCWRTDIEKYFNYDGVAWNEFQVGMAEIDNFEHCGDYNENVTYRKYNMVYYDEPGYEGTYIVHDEGDGGIKGVVPTNIEHWYLTVPLLAGPPGEDGTAGPPGPPGDIEGVVGPKKSTLTETVDVGKGSSKTGSITFECSPNTGPEIILLKVSITPNADTVGFVFQLFGDPSRTDLLYELDTREDDEYTPGSGVRDPNQGFLPVCYFIDSGAEVNAVEGSLWYKIINNDIETATGFTINIDYKALV